MPRPKKCRWVQGRPEVVYFKPRGIPLKDLQEIVLPIEGLEAVRLADLEKMEHEEAAALMKVSRPTFSRVLSNARSVVARALVEGFALRIEGGHFEVMEVSGADPATERRPGRKGRRQGHRDE